MPLKNLKDFKARKAQNDESKNDSSAEEKEETPSPLVEMKPLDLKKAQRRSESDEQGKLASHRGSESEEETIPRPSRRMSRFSNYKTDKSKKGDKEVVDSTPKRKRASPKKSTKASVSGGSDDGNRGKDRKDKPPRKTKLQLKLERKHPQKSHPSIKESKHIDDCGTRTRPLFGLRVQRWASFMLYSNVLLGVVAMIHLQIACLFVGACVGSDDPKVDQRVRSEILPLCLFAMVYVAPFGYFSAQLRSPYTAILHIIQTITVGALFLELSVQSFMYSADLSNKIDTIWTSYPSSTRKYYGNAETLMAEVDGSAILLAMTQLVVSLVSLAVVCSTAMFVLRLRDS